MAKRTEERRLLWRESPMGEGRGEGGLACNFPLARAGPLLRTTIAHSVTTKLAPFSQHKTGKTVERERGRTSTPRFSEHTIASAKIFWCSVHLSARTSLAAFFRAWQQFTHETWGGVQMPCWLISTISSPLLFSSVFLALIRMAVGLSVLSKVASLASSGM